MTTNNSNSKENEMSKLDVIVLEYGNAVLDLHRTNDPIGKPVDEATQAIKDLILSIAEKDAFVDIAYKSDIIRLTDLQKRINEL